MTVTRNGPVEAVRFVAVGVNWFSLGHFWANAEDIYDYARLFFPGRPVHLRACPRGDFQAVADELAKQLDKQDRRN